MTIIFCIVAFILGLLIGVFLARKRTVNSSGYLHIIRDSSEKKPYIFLELTDSDEIREIEKSDYVVLTVDTN